MTCRIPGCVGDYDLEHIASIAKKRFIEGFDTITLMQEAKTQNEKEEVVLISMLKVEDDQIRELELCCPHEQNCKVLDCRKRLKALLEQQLKD